MRNARHVNTFAVCRIFAAIDDIRRHPWPDKLVYPNNRRFIFQLDEISRNKELLHSLLSLLVLQIKIHS